MAQQSQPRLTQLVHIASVALPRGDSGNGGCRTLGLEGERRVAGVGVQGGGVRAEGLLVPPSRGESVTEAAVVGGRA